MTKHDDIPWTTSTGRLYDDEGELVDDHAEYRLVPESQARALFEGARMILSIDDKLNAKDYDERTSIVLTEAIALLKKGIGK